jgi:predicted glutamine amidotransferase
MCRWMAWSGQPVLIEERLFITQHGLTDQSLHSRIGAETTNGAGFRLGWYGAGKGPGACRSVARLGRREPAPPRRPSEPRTVARRVHEWGNR